MFVAVRASAPVAAMPPKNGATMLPIPRPTSSAFGSCFLPVIASAMTAESSDSMAPSMAMASAGENKSLALPSVIPPEPHGSIGIGGTCGIPATSRPLTTLWKRDPMVATWKPGRHARQDRRRRPTRGRSRPAGRGWPCRCAARPRSSARVTARDPELDERGVVPGRPEHLDLLEVPVRQLCDRKPKHVLDLQRGDDRRDPRGEAGGHRDEG